MDYKQCCLTCLGSHQDMRDLKSAVSISGQNVQLTKILNTFYNFKVPEDERYPDKICITCVHQLTVTFSFKILIETSAMKLSKIMLLKEEKPDTNDDNNSIELSNDDNEQNVDSDKDVKIKKEEKSEKIKDTQKPKSQKNQHTNTQGKRYLNMKNLRQPKLLYCVECKASFYSVRGLRRHCSENHSVKNTAGRACEWCFEKFETFRAAFLHRKLHYKPYICNDCWEGFETNENLNSHKCSKPDKATKESLKQCDQCGKSYKPGYIRIHLLTHKEERTYSCKQCPKTFKTLGCLFSHVQWTHKRVKKHKCEYCNALYMTSSAKCAHVRKIHLREKKNVCKCGKGFFSKSELGRHLLTHTGVKNFHCHLCEKAYQTRHGLNVHLKSHLQMNVNVMNF